MSKTMPLSTKKVIKAPENMGFEQAIQRGSHLFLRHLGRKNHDSPGVHSTQKSERE